MKKKNHTYLLEGTIVILNIYIHSFNFDYDDK